jgi:hypothetical protein
MKLSAAVDEEPGAFRASGESPPPQSTIPPHLAEELAEIIADAIVADYRRDGLNRSDCSSSAAKKIDALDSTGEGEPCTKKETVSRNSDLPCLQQDADEAA